MICPMQLDNVVVVDLDNGTVTCKALETPLPALPQHAEETFKQRYVLCSFIQGL